MMKHSLLLFVLTVAGCGCERASAPTPEPSTADRFFELLDSDRKLEDLRASFPAIVKQGASATQYKSILSRAHRTHEGDGKRTYFFYPHGAVPREEFDWELQVVVDPKTDRVEEVAIMVYEM